MTFFPYKIDKKWSDSNQNLNFYCFENCWYLIKVAYKYWKFHQLHVAVILNKVFSTNWGIVAENGKKANKIPKRGDFDVKSINARPCVKCARMTLNRISIFLALSWVVEKKKKKELLRIEFYPWDIISADNTLGTKIDISAVLSPEIFLYQFDIILICFDLRDIFQISADKIFRRTTFSASCNTLSVKR